MSAAVCCYCGREGHRASHCPWRAAQDRTVKALQAAVGAQRKRGAAVKSTLAAPAEAVK